jgi:hypothetical protein
MKNFMFGTLFGLVLASVGFAGIARIMDRAVDATKTQAQDLAR